MNINRDLGDDPNSLSSLVLRIAGGPTRGNYAPGGPAVVVVGVPVRDGFALLFRFAGCDC